MKVLVVGGGGREHALAWGLSKSPAVQELWTTSTNAGICALAKCADIEGEGITGLVDWAADRRIDLTVVGPEAQLTVGIVDAFRERGLAIMGPTKAAAEIESSKAFAKELMVRNHVPTAKFAICETSAAARQAARAMDLPVVIKADGLAAGKGVSICHSWQEVEAAISAIMEERVFGEAGDRVLVEEFLTGPEVSVLAFVSGTDIVVMPPAQDHKAAYDGDQGPNTGGMGTYSPVAGLPADFLPDVEQRILRPTVEAMDRLGRPFTGVLFAGLMLTPTGPQVLEFNCRFGDPETQVLIPRLDSDLAEVLAAVAGRSLNRVQAKWSARAAVCVVMASGGYPGHYETGYPITGLSDVAALPNVQVFHAGTALQDGQVVTAGGRVLGVTAWADTTAGAVQRAYAAVDRIHFSGAFYRRDIAHRALTQV